MAETTTATVTAPDPKQTTTATATGVDPKQTTTAPATFTLKVNGQERQVTQEELIILAQKNAAAEAGLEEVARLKREAGQAQVVGDAILEMKRAQAAGTVNEELIRSVGAKLGSSPEDVERTVAKWKEGQKAAPAAGGAEGGTLLTEEDLPKSVRDRLARLEALEQRLGGQLPDIERAAADAQEAARQKIFANIYQEVDNDQILGKLNVGPDGKTDAAKQATIRELVRDEVVRRVRSGENYDQNGPQIRSAAIATVRQRLADLGIRPAEGRRGPTSEQVASLGTLDTDLTALLQATSKDGPPKRVAATDPGWEQNLLLRLTHQAAQQEGAVSNGGF